ncbi:MAG: glycoside hydrolase family 55 protein [Candidatus Hydrogenedentes bacterium]|nr:glycoside hydrolase family 55 protein [Candidatus Hydrogenedentota bacterium]
MSFRAVFLSAFSVVLLLAARQSFAQPGGTVSPDGANVVNVVDFGAKGDGLGDDAAPIQKALDSGAALVTIPKGVYLVARTLQIPSDVTLKADPEAVIRLADGAGTHARVFVLTNKNQGNGNRNITVEGGIWDGNNEHNHRGKDGDLNGYTGTAINFVNVKNLTLRDLTVRNPDAFSIRLGEVEDFLVENIVLDHTVIRPNQDGVHVGGFSQRGTIRNIRALHPNTPNDDMIALNADDDVERVLNLGMRRGPIRDILVEDIQAEGAYNFVRLLSQEARLENIVVRRVSGTCRIYAVNMNRWRFPAGSGDIRNVRLEEFDVTKTPGSAPAQSLIHITLMVRDLYITDFQRNSPSEASKATTLLLDNGRTNTIQEGDGPPQEKTTAFSIPQGSIKALWVNRSPSVQPQHSDASSK